MPLYTADILRLAARIVADTLLEGHDARSEQRYARCEKRSVLCGSEVTADIVLGPDHRVLAHGQKVRACALGQAAAAILANGVAGRNAAELRAAEAALRLWLEEEGPLDVAALAPFPELSLLAPARAHRARHASILLAFDAAATAAEEAEAKLAG